MCSERLSSDSEGEELIHAIGRPPNALGSSKYGDGSSWPKELASLPDLQQPTPGCAKFTTGFPLRSRHVPKHSKPAPLGWSGPWTRSVAACAPKGGMVKRTSSSILSRRRAGGALGPPPAASASTRSTSGIFSELTHELRAASRTDTAAVPIDLGEMDLWGIYDEQSTILIDMAQGAIGEDSFLLE